MSQIKNQHKKSTAFIQDLLGDNSLENAGWGFKKNSNTKGTISINRGGGQVIQILSNYAIMFEVGGLDAPTISNLKIIDLNTEKVMNEYPDQNTNDSTENNKEETTKSSVKVDKEKLKKQLTDKTFKAPLTIEEGAFRFSEIEAGMTTYLISSKENPQDFELEHLDDPTDEGMSLFLLRKDSHNGNMFVAGYYAVNKNGYVYEYDFAKEKAKDTPLTNLYVEELLNPKDQKMILSSPSNSVGGHD